MSTEDLNNSLQSLGKAITEMANAPRPMPTFNDREISGNKIHGGMITQFASRGITDTATRMQLLVSDDGITVDTIETDTLTGDVAVTGNLTVEGELVATRIKVDELIADVRNERSESLEFVGDQLAGKGLIWRTNDYSRQLVFHRNPDRFFATENVDLQNGKVFSIGSVPVLSDNALGTGITSSNLQSLGHLNELNVSGNVSFGEYLFWESSSERLGIGTETPNGTFAIANLDAEFIVDSENDSGIRIGNFTNSDLQVITDDTTRLIIKANGNIVIGTQGSDNSRVNLYGKLGVGVNNIESDVSISSAGPIKFQGKRMETSASIPQAGNYSQGDIVWNNNPQPTGYVGWICVRDGTPGEWKPFGLIGK